MPELPEVETVRRMLKEKVQNRKIINVKIAYPKVIEQPTIEVFEKEIINETIIDMKRRGKWLIFELDHYYLLSHLRMEGKYLIRHTIDQLEKHEHIAFVLDNGEELRYKDTRKFGRMYLLNKEEAFYQKPLSELGKEPWDPTLTAQYLKDKFKHKTIPIKTILLDQGIITGIGNIYANEILFLSKISPFQKGNTVTIHQLQAIIENTRKVLEKAITEGGTTIRSYESSEGVHGRFQQQLYVHSKENEPCSICNTPILKTKIGGRGTYYCPNCQK